MLAPRLIPSLLIDDGRLVKTVRFEAPFYLGDPLNAVKILSDLEADELLLLDRARARDRREPDLAALQPLLSECTMPVSYGGALDRLEQIERVLHAGAEKVVINTAAHLRPELIAEAAARFGSQSIVCGVDVLRDERGAPRVMVEGGRTTISRTFSDTLRLLNDEGAGELLLSSIDADGTREGFDLGLIEEAAAIVSIPIIAAGGGASLEHCVQAIRSGASAVSCGSMFVFHRSKAPGVLISYNAPLDRPAELRPQR